MHGLTGGGWKRSDLATVTAVKRPAGETRGKLAAGPNARQRHRASPRPYNKLLSFRKTREGVILKKFNQITNCYLKAKVDGDQSILASLSLLIRILLQVRQPCCTHSYCTAEHNGAEGYKLRPISVTSRYHDPALFCWEQQPQTCGVTACAAPNQHRASPGPRSYSAVRSGQAAAKRMILWPAPSTRAQPARAEPLPVQSIKQPQLDLHSRLHNPGTYRVKAPGRYPLSGRGGRSRLMTPTTQTIHQCDNPARRSGVKATLTPNRRRAVENDQYAAFVRRVIAPTPAESPPGTLTPSPT